VKSLDAVYIVSKKHRETYRSYTRNADQVVPTPANSMVYRTELPFPMQMKHCHLKKQLQDRQNTLENESKQKKIISQKKRQQNRTLMTPTACLKLHLQKILLRPKNETPRTYRGWPRRVKVLLQKFVALQLP
jgi:hypothetical protein